MSTMITVYPDDRRLVLYVDGKATRQYRPGDAVEPGLLQAITVGLWTAAERIKSQMNWSAAPVPGGLYHHNGKEARPPKPDEMPLPTYTTQRPDNFEVGKSWQVHGLHQYRKGDR